MPTANSLILWRPKGTAFCGVGCGVAGAPAGIVCTFIAFFTAALVIYMHRGNIKRLAAHTEKKLGEKAK